MKVNVCKFTHYIMYYKIVDTYFNMYYYIYFHNEEKGYTRVSYTYYIMYYFLMPVSGKTIFPNQVYILYYVFISLTKYSPMDTTTTGYTDQEIEDLMKKIGKRIRYHRKKVEKNYEVFAQKYGINKVTIQRMETGQNFTINSLLQVLGILGISLEDFFTGLDD